MTQRKLLGGESILRAAICWTRLDMLYLCLSSSHKRVGGPCARMVADATTRDRACFGTSRPSTTYDPDTERRAISGDFSALHLGGFLGRHFDFAAEKPEVLR